MLIDLISLARRIVYVRLSGTHTHCSHTHTRTHSSHTHTLFAYTLSHFPAVIERLFKEAQLSKIIVYYAAYSCPPPPPPPIAPSYNELFCDKISYQRRNTHVRCQQKTTKKKEKQKRGETASAEIVRNGPNCCCWPASKLMCVPAHSYIYTLYIHIHIHIYIASLTGYTSIGSSSGVSASASEDLRGPVRPPPDELVPEVPVPA